MAKQRYEVKFLNVSHDALRSKLRDANGVLVYPSRTMQRVVYDWPYRPTDSFVRVREEGDCVTMTYKAYENDREVEVLETTVGDRSTAQAILERMGATVKSRQESKREEWQLDGCKVMLDEWPWIAPFIEIKGENEAAVKEIVEKLGFRWNQAVEGSVNEAYRGEYAIPKGKHICDEPNIAFHLPPPEWIKALKR